MSCQRNTFVPNNYYFLRSILNLAYMQIILICWTDIPRPARVGHRAPVRGEHSPALLALPDRIFDIKNCRYFSRTPFVPVSNMLPRIQVNISIPTYL